MPLYDYHRHRVSSVMPYVHLNAVKIEALEAVKVKAVNAETLDITWDLPGSLQYYNVSIIHNIQWVPRPWSQKPHFLNVRQFVLSPVRR